MIDLAVVALVVVVALWIGWANLPVILTSLGFEIPIDKLGQWGDSFGALNTLFAAGGFTAVIWTLRLQQKQIKAAEIDQQKQRFESSYFELLRLLREARKDVKFRPTKKTTSPLKPASKPTDVGLAAFRSAWIEAKERIDQISFINRTIVASIYDKNIHSRFESNFGPYFRILYTILSRIREDKSLSSEEKARYGNLLRSQLNSYELAVVALNGLSSVSKDFAELLTEFHFLKYLPLDRRKIFESLYPVKAFASRD